MQRIDSLLSIADDFDAFFVDVFGVLWDGQAFYPNALKVCEKLIQQGKKIYVLSNMTVTNEHFKKKHVANGCFEGVHYTDVISSGDVFKSMLEEEDFMDQVTGSKDSKYLLIGLANDELLTSVLHRQTLDVTQAAAVYAGALQEKIDGQHIFHDDTKPYEALAQQALDRNLPMICANPDYYAFHQNNVKHVTQGSLGQWYEDRGGKVYWIGKPYSNIYDYALKKTGVKAKRSAMVGDTIRTDILGGMRAGMKTVLIVGCCGVTQYKLDNGETLQQIEEKEGATPDYIMMKGLK